MRQFDVVIIGSGFAGSLLGLILVKQGLSVLIIDRAAHARFAIGESSTPAADFILESLCERYQLTSLRPLCRYGRWCRERPNISRGLKRGFSYFHHLPGQTFHSSLDHSHELLVAASVNDEVGDTHWYRADVDQYVAKQFVTAGGTLWEHTTIEAAEPGEHWRLQIQRPTESTAVKAGFLVDGTGGSSALVHWLNLPCRVDPLTTSSRSLFSHFHDVSLWSDCLARNRIDQSQYPYPCDQAALHHIIPGGWMWVLRFDNGITSVGWSLNTAAHPATPGLSPLVEWQQLLAQYPSVADHLHTARPASPFAATDCPIMGTGRLQRLVQQTTGPHWALLPHTAGFIDPFYSTGIAHSLRGVERLATILTTTTGRAEQLANYSASIARELRLVDQLVALAFRGMGHDPQLLHAASMLYFAAATTFESRRKSGTAGDFLLADDPEFLNVVGTVASDFPADPRDLEQVAAWCQRVKTRIAPWNHVGLFNPRFPNLYWHTAADKSDF